MMIICIAMATGYSMFNEKLTIHGTAIAKMEEEEIIVPPAGTDENGVDRFSATTSVENLFGMELLRVTKEECVGNSITTTMEVVSRFALLPRTLEITLQIQNGSKYTFTNGKIELVESADSENAFTPRSQTLSTVTVEPGATTTANMSGTINVGRIETGTYYKYKISFDSEDGKVKEFYYTLKLEP